MTTLICIIEIENLFAHNYNKQFCLQNYQFDLSRFRTIYCNGHLLYTQLQMTTEVQSVLIYYFCMHNWNLQNSLMQICHTQLFMHYGHW